MDACTIGYQRDCGGLDALLEGPEGGEERSAAVPASWFIIHYMCALPPFPLTRHPAFESDPGVDGPTGFASSCGIVYLRP